MKSTVVLLRHYPVSIADSTGIPSAPTRTSGRASASRYQTTTHFRSAPIGLESPVAILAWIKEGYLAEKNAEKSNKGGSVGQEQQ